MKIILAPAGVTKYLIDGVNVANFSSVERLDVTVYGTGDHTITGGALDDRITTGTGRSLIDSGGGNDYIHFGEGGDKVTAGGGNDTVGGYLFGKADVDLGAGDDQLTLSFYSAGPAFATASYRGGAGNDTLMLGGSGTDALSFDGTTIKLGDTIIGTASGFESVQVSGGSANDSIQGSALADLLRLGAGNDTADGGAGNDTIDGNIFGAGSDGNDVILGGAGDDTLKPGNGNDKVNGGAGADRVEVSYNAAFDTGVDSLDGGAGIDTLIMPFGPAGPIVMTGNLATTAQIKSNGILIAKASNFEAIQISGSSGDDILLGGTGNDTLNALAGIDKITSGNGDDQLSIAVGAGVDTVQAGGGTDTVSISAFVPGNVVLSHGAGGSEVRIDGVLAADITDAEIFSIFTGDGDDVLEGGALGDSFNANMGANSLSGGGGDDFLSVALDGEVDTIEGGAGNDRVSVFLIDGDDTLVIVPAAGGKVTFKVGATTLATATGVEAVSAFGGNGKDKFTGLAGNDVLSGGTNIDTIKGQNGDDSISGGNDNDKLEGGAGNDTISGDFGSDDITGGAGADQFRFFSSLHGNDTVSDFTAADSIGISGFAFGLVAGSAVNLISGADPTVPPDTFGRFFLFDTDTGQLSFDLDGSGASAAVHLAVLEDGGSAATLTAGQITVF